MPLTKKCCKLLNLKLILTFYYFLINSKYDNFICLIKKLRCCFEAVTGAAKDIGEIDLKTANCNLLLLNWPMGNRILLFLNYDMQLLPLNSDIKIAMLIPTMRNTQIQ